jgi:DNA-directed RNA polymerase subunit M/transcription elongation factor TFIIS
MKCPHCGKEINIARRSLQIMKSAATLGKIGGKKSKRTITPEQHKMMMKAREEKRAEKKIKQEIEAEREKYPIIETEAEAKGTSDAEILPAPAPDLITCPKCRKDNTREALMSQNETFGIITEHFRCVHCGNDFTNQVRAEG